jgi:hypothetical protein
VGVVRLRELAAVTALAMAGMGGLMAAAQGGFKVPGGAYFHVAKAEAATKPIVLASNESNAELRLGQSTAPAVMVPYAPEPSLNYVSQAMGRLRGNVSSELYPYFDVFLYVSKAASGPLAQRMYMFHKNPNGDIVFEQTFLVSTGRERHEKYFTTTPVGVFELDPNRFERYHYSRTWNAGMPYSMFLNATIRGRQTGIALHSSGRSHEAALGNRASGGCVRLPPEKAAELFNRFQREERGYVPVFAFDRGANRTSKYGQMVRDASGKPITYYGYKVLLLIEDYPGGPLTIAAIA